MLGDADPVAIGHCNRHAALDGGLEIDMVQADAGCDRELELFAFAILSAVR